MIIKKNYFENNKVEQSVKSISLYSPTFMFPWNYSTIGPDTNRRTFEIGT